MTMMFARYAVLIGLLTEWGLSCGVQMGIQQTPVRFNKPPALHN